METLVSLAPLLILIVLMYFLMIRPQKKKDKQIQEMRRGLQVGDEIITIGGICGKIVKTKEETIVIQVGADKVKFEMMRWAVSTVTNASQRVREEVEEEPKKVMPKRLRRSSDADDEEKDSVED
ncbi:MAG: preprotein translocase subunit YajC [Firmicutes bacterium]|nr:preprotein translocase subunit YajC [Bacillota bacterium]